MKKTIFVVALLMSSAALADDACYERILPKVNRCIQSTAKVFFTINHISPEATKEQEEEIVNSVLATAREQCMKRFLSQIQKCDQ